MTDYAFEFFKFILHHNFFIHRNGFVTRRTGYFCVFTIQQKPCFAVIKIRHFPSFHTMTSGTIGDTFLLKLLIVYLFVALAARCGQAGKFPMRIRSIGYVTGSAILLQMRALQCKRCLTVIKAILLPTCRQVALLTSIVQVPFLSNLSLVNIFMTINTPTANIPEFPFFLLLVTGKTRGCHMRSVERKCRLGVLLQGKGAPSKSINGVASCAVGLTR